LNKLKIRVFTIATTRCNALQRAATQRNKATQRNAVVEMLFKFTIEAG